MTKNTPTVGKGNSGGACHNLWKEKEQNQISIEFEWLATN